MKNSSKTCVYIGIGHMGFPIFQATRNHFLADGWSVIAVDKDPERLDLIADRDVLKTADVPAKADIVFLGVRPQSFVTAEDLATTATIVVSMMAGITSQTIQQRFSNASVVRIIPNTPCEFGRGITPYFVNQFGSPPPETSTLLAALANAGPLLPVADEGMIDCATGLSAGGPAYVMQLADGMIEAAIALGFSPGEARALVANTILGSADLLLRTGKSPSELANEVMTPNGTTERGINILQKHGVKEIVGKAILAASNRAKDLSSLEME